MKWIQISQSLPEETCRVLVYGRRGIEMVTYNKHNNCWDDADGDDHYATIGAFKYWMPLPKPPQEATINVYFDHAQNMAKVTVNDNLVMEGNTWDFHPACHGIYQYGDFNDPISLANQINNLLHNNPFPIFSTIKMHEYKYGT